MYINICINAHIRMLVLQSNGKGSLLYIMKKVDISVCPNDYRILFHE